MAVKIKNDQQEGQVCKAQSQYRTFKVAVPNPRVSFQKQTRFPGKTRGGFYFI